MSAVPRLGAGLKIGFVCLTMGALIVACGSISVIEEESLDGSSGSGGMTGNGAGGGHGGASGGTTGGTGGTAGTGIGGSNAGSGGTGAGGRLGGSGGTVGGIGGGGGTGGRLGTGGSGGLGGTPGLGGSGGLGGGSGLGGLTGGLGGASGGAGGGTGTSCAQLQRDFSTALAEAKTCTVPLSNQCSLITNDRIECGCPTSVTRTDKVDAIRSNYRQLGCTTGVCPAVFCGYVTGGSCTQVVGSGFSCVDQLSGTDPV